MLKNGFNPRFRYYGRLTRVMVQPHLRLFYHSIYFLSQKGSAHTSKLTIQTKPLIPRLMNSFQIFPEHKLEASKKYKILSFRQFFPESFRICNLSFFFILI